MGSEIESLSREPFTAKLEQADCGPLSITHAAHSAMRSVSTKNLIRKGGQDSLLVVLRNSGRSVMQQEGREAVTEAGDIVVVDRRPLVDVTRTESCFILDLPRERLERALGSARLYTAVTVPAGLASASLASNYLRELVRVRTQLSPEAAVRMADIGVDLIVASIAERLARDLPQPLHGSVVVQRARAHVEANLSDMTLDPPQLAAAVGVSLRRLQELFHERGRHISDYIWDRRLEVASERLVDPACAHLSIGLLAYGCGFTSQAHFSRRFKDRHGMTPREFRTVAILAA